MSTARAPPPPCSPASSTAWSPLALPRRPLVPLDRSHLSPPPSRARPMPSPPLAACVATATVHPSPCRSAQKNHRRLLHRLRQPVRSRELCNLVLDLIFFLGHRRSPLGFRRRQAFPEHAEITVDPAVSSPTEPLSPRRRFPALAPLTIRADSSSPPAMSPPRLRPCKHAFKLTTELTAPPWV